MILLLIGVVMATTMVECEKDNEILIDKDLAYCFCVTINECYLMMVGRNL